ncbi:MAG: hypothetical protein HOP30_15930 [Cyclobacteriaceae bacterium]|nr:hypothetical protein [Cyclobacteriaceae bacterium]
MKTVLLAILLISTTAMAQSDSSIHLDDINLDGRIHRRTSMEKMEMKRRKLERRTLKRMYMMMEYRRYQSEMMLMMQTEQAMKMAFNNIGNQ